MKATDMIGFGRTGRWALGAALVLSAGAALAAGRLELENTVFQEIEVQTDDGRTEIRQVPATRVVPGTEVIYGIDYGNVGDGPVENVAITNPIPDELVFVDGDGAVPVTAVSVDDGAQYGDLAELTVAGPDGEPRPAQPSDVTHLRWVLPALPAGGEGAVSFRARVR